MNFRLAEVLLGALLTSAFLGIGWTFGTAHALPADGEKWVTTKDILTFIGVMAWPIVVLIGLLIFRSSIASVLLSLKSFKVAGTEATFDREIKAATEQAKALEIVEPGVAGFAAVPPQRLTQLIDMAAVSPTGAVIEAWKDIEQSASNLVERSAPRSTYSYDSSRPYLSLQRFIEQNQLLSNAEIAIFRELRQLRNRAAHARDDEVSVEQARQYVRLAIRLVDAINSVPASVAVMEARPAVPEPS